MKLNNKGWGLSIFLVFIVVFFIAIIIIAHISKQYGYGPVEEPHITNTLLQRYKSYETEVKESAIRYQEYNYPTMQNGDGFIVNIKNLDIKSEITYTCTGYVKYGITSDIYYYEPYLHCGNYKTAGYSSTLDN